FVSAHQDGLGVDRLGCFVHALGHLGGVFSPYFLGAVSDVAACAQATALAGAASAAGAVDVVHGLAGGVLCHGGALGGPWCGVTGHLGGGPVQGQQGGGQVAALDHDQGEGVGGGRRQGSVACRGHVQGGCSK